MASTVTADSCFKTVVEADFHRVDVTSGRCSRRIQLTSNSSPVKTSHRWTAVTALRSSPRHPRDLDTGARYCGGTQIGRTSSNVETRSSAKAEVGTRRVHSCEYHGRSTRQLPHVRPPWPMVRCKPSVPPPAPDKVPRYNDTGSFEEVDERLLMLEGFRVDRCRNSAPAAGSVRQPCAANVSKLMATGGRSMSLLQDVVSAQYRKLWDLRATLEESEDLSEDDRSVPSTSTANAAGQPGRPGNTAPATHERPANIAPSYLPIPSEVRRQSYQHLAVERRLRQPVAAPSSGPPGASVDSVEAPETDGDASDTSRYDFTTTSFESSTTTTTTTDNNTDANDSRVCPIRSPRSSALSTAGTCVGGSRSREAERSAASGVDGASRMFVDGGTPPSSTLLRRSCSDISDVAERVELNGTEAISNVTASLRSAARKRRDFRNERMTLHHFALDHDDLQSSTDQPSGDSVDGGGGTASPSAASRRVRAAIPCDHAARCGPPSALRRFLSYQLSSRSSSSTRNIRCRHPRSRDYRSVLERCGVITVIGRL